ncbi:hypothetical protein [Limnohabitans planktonicus]|uniref:hypothetical protein n=1 Tax=Limnohabitans planktonicus TaxID=540060 RepID=UPI00069F4F2B|nr:hypothetical protein [Limnohabitans planktonicus]|eukprot:gene13303-15324_t
MSTSPKTNVTWSFRARFRRDAFGWKGSKLASQRIKEALIEIHTVARHDPVQGAEGAVLLLEKLSPALSQIDSSSGAIGSACYGAIEALVPLIAGAPASTALRKKWLDRLFEAIQADQVPYIETLGEHWGELCATPELASEWADQLLPGLRLMLGDRAMGTFATFTGTSLCYSALFTAGRHDELLQLLSLHPHPIWPYFVWGARVLAARGQTDQAIAYVREHAGSTTGLVTMARFAEDLLLRAGRRSEAFEQYALLANQSNSNLSTFRALAKKYPEWESDKLLAYLVALSPSESGKWFATAKTLKLWDQAIQLAWASPCDPLTLTRAASDHLNKRADFAMHCALAALHWMSMGYGYDLTALDARQAYLLALEAAALAQQSEHAQAVMAQILAQDRPMSASLNRSLGLTPAAGQLGSSGPQNPPIH